MWDRAVEAAPGPEVRARAAAAWEAQCRRLLESSPFHRRRLSRVPLSELDRLPFTTKEDLRAALDEDPPFGSNLGVPPEAVKRVYQTSGTTGSPSVIALTAADAAAWVEIGSRTYYATGIHDHHSAISTFGAGPFVAGHTYFVLERIGARSVPVGPGDTARVLFALRAGLADTLLATPSFARHLARQAGGPLPGLRHVVTGGEPGGGIPEVRDHVEAALGATVNEIMGIGDVSPSLFGECPEGQGMHFCGAGHVWPELVDPGSGEALEIEAGATGELVYTHLTREAMPVVRFRSGDLVRIEGTECACGRTGFRMRCLGRLDEMFIVRGVNVYPSAILAVLAEFRPRLTGRARVVRSGGGAAVEPPVPVEVEVGETEVGKAEATPGLAAEVEAAIRARLSFRAEVRLLPEAEFGDAGYKTPLVVRR